MLEAWLEARDADSVRRAWTALAPRRHTFAKNRKLTFHGAALLAEAMLGTRADWILESRKRRPPEFEVDRIVDESFVDGGWVMTGRSRETWKLHEQRDEVGGVQVLLVECSSIVGQPEGGGQTFVRVFDGDRAVSIAIDRDQVWTIGEVDLAPLDLLDFLEYFSPSSYDIDALRGLVAQVVTELDAHFDTSPLWREIDRRREADHEYRVFGDLPRSVAIRLDRHATPSVSVHGLPWGHALKFAHGYVRGRLPNADIDRVLARLAAISSAT